MALTTRQRIDSLVWSITAGLNRPHDYFDSNGKINVGCLVLDKNDAGYAFGEVVTVAGGERDWSGRMSAKEMHAYLNGLNSGLAMRDSYYGHDYIRKKVVEATGCPEDLYHLYSEEWLEAFNRAGLEIPK